MEKLKNDQCTSCEHAAMCKYIEAYDRTIEALNEHISARRPLHSELPAGFHISVYCQLFLPRTSTVPRGSAK